ncbi:unnamed protein product, partial [Rotaria sp. Silwood1]
VEDFINSASTTPMSSVPVQFLIYVMPEPTCSISPVIIPLTGCLEVKVGTMKTFNISIINQCDPDVSDIADLIVSNGITGMQAGNLTYSSTNDSLLYVTFTWTPQLSQLGSQILCTIAFTDEQVQSTQYCVTFTVRQPPQLPLPQLRQQQQRLPLQLLHLLRQHQLRRQLQLLRHQQQPRLQRPQLQRQLQLQPQQQQQPQQQLQQLPRLQLQQRPQLQRQLQLQQQQQRQQQQQLQQQPRLQLQQRPQLQQQQQAQQQAQRQAQQRPQLQRQHQLQRQPQQQPQQQPQLQRQQRPQLQRQQRPQPQHQQQAPAPQLSVEDL